MTIYFFNTIIRLITWGYKNKLGQLTVDLSESMIGLLSILQKNGIIDYYIIKKTKNNLIKAIIFFKYYRDQPGLQSIHIFSKPSHYHFISHHNLKKLILKPNSTSTIFILNTSKGIISGNEAIKIKIGGILLAKMN